MGRDPAPAAPAGPPLRRTTAELSAAQLVAIRSLMDVAFGDDPDGAFDDDDWAHAIGGLHVFLEARGEILAHASIVEREIRIDDRPLRTGYVEAVATAPARRGQGLGSIVMNDVNAWIREHVELGMLGTGSHHFYERLGWRTWRGPSAVQTAAGLRRTPDDDGYLMVLTTPTTPPLDLDRPISCAWRPGDVW
jgi:aminoglycoside 2'-N-acetyltransferase I